MTNDKNIRQQQWGKTKQHRMCPDWRASKMYDFVWVFRFILCAVVRWTCNRSLLQYFFSVFCAFYGRATHFCPMRTAYHGELPIFTMHSSKTIAGGTQKKPSHRRILQTKMSLPVFWTQRLIA